jgi:hypothetical protein
MYYINAKGLFPVPMQPFPFEIHKIGSLLKFDDFYFLINILLMIWQTTQLHIYRCPVDTNRVCTLNEHSAGQGTKTRKVRNNIEQRMEREKQQKRNNAIQFDIRIQDNSGGVHDMDSVVVIKAKYKVHCIGNPVSYIHLALVLVSLLLRTFALTPHANLQHFLVCALSFSVSRPLGGCVVYVCARVCVCVLCLCVTEKD